MESVTPNLTLTSLLETEQNCLLSPRSPLLDPGFSQAFVMGSMVQNPA